MKKTLITAVAVLALTLASMPAQAQVGIVYDPTNYHSALLRYGQLIAHLNQLRATYVKVLNHYNLAVQMSRSIPNIANRYSASWSPWRYASAQDTYGNAGSWLNGANSGVVGTVLNGYLKATNTLLTYTPALLSGMPLNEKQRVQSDSATIELVDGAAQNALETIGAIRSNATSALRTIGNIQNDSLSNNPNLNTEVGVLNKVNATNVLSLQNALDTNKLLVAILEQQTILSKQLRDSATNITNADINRRQNLTGLNQQISAGVGQTLNSYRLP